VLTAPTIDPQYVAAMDHVTLLPVRLASQLAAIGDGRDLPQPGARN
jgi:hypothetical protein